MMENYQFLELTLSLQKEWPASLRQACRTGASTGHKYPVMAESRRDVAPTSVFLFLVLAKLFLVLLSGKKRKSLFFPVFSRLEGHDGSYRN